MPSDQIEFKVSEGLIKPIIEAKINAAIIEAMGGHEKMIAEMLVSFMSQKVDSDGKASGYSSNKPRVEWLVTKMIEEALKNALMEFMNKKREFVHSEFEKFFNSKKGSLKIVEAMQEGFCKSLLSQWNTQIIFKPTRD